MSIRKINFVHRALLQDLQCNARSNLRNSSAGTFIYAAVFLTEGTGLSRPQALG